MTGPRYHHGDLRTTLLREATTMMRDGGLEGLTLRKLAERADVTPPALYHHFRDKNDLLCALAEQGFAELDERVSTTLSGGDLGQRLSKFVHTYVRFASEHPEQYDLMFGRTIWKAGRASEALRTRAYATFRKYVEQITAMIGEAGAVPGTNVLRVAQASWAMLHGLCRLRIDGIYVDSGDLDAMSDEAVRFLLGRLGKSLRV